MLRKTFLLLLFTLGLATTLSAQCVVSGTVRDAKTFTPIAGATVMLDGTTRGTATDAHGHYSIDNVPRGRQSLRVSLLSYKDIFSETDLTDGTAALDFLLEEEPKQIGEVIVTGRVRGDTENGMVGTVKLSPQIASGVSAAQISKSPDRTASEVVRRVAGVAIMDDRFVVVRGLSQRYNNAWINGISAPSTENDSRAFSFDMIPGSQIENLLVYKSPSPENPGDFSGGFIKITTKGLPDKNEVEISYQVGANIPTLRTDFLFNPRKGHHGFNDDWRVRSIKHQSVFPLLDHKLSLSMGRRIELKDGKTLGNITALTFGNTFKTARGVANARYGIWSMESDKPVFINNYLDDQYSKELRLGAMHNWTLALSRANRVEFRNLFNFVGRDRLTERAGTSEVSGLYYQRQTEMLYTSRLTYTGQFSGTHGTPQGGTLSWDAGYSYANRREPDRKIASWQAGIEGEGDIPTVQLDNDNIKRYSQRLDDHTISLSANHRQPLGKTILQTGLYGYYLTRNYAPREYIYRYDRLSYDERQPYLRLSLEGMMSSPYVAEGRVWLEDITRKTDAYSADVIHGTAYALVDLPLGPVSIHAGARLESHTSRLRYDRTNVPDRTLPTTNRVSDLNLLPSVNITWRVNNKHQLRAAYGRSVNRPELRELSPSIYYDFDMFREIGGNPDLKTAVVDNADLRWEFYPSAGETVSVGAFYKHFARPIEWRFIDMGGTLRYLYENARSAVSWGFELDLRKKLDFVGLPNFSITLNAAWINSNVRFRPGEVVREPDRPMQGQSPYLVNAGISYNATRASLDVVVLYNRVGKRIIGLGKSNSVDPDPNTMIPDSYEMPRNSLDVSVSKKLGKRFELRASVKDILSEDVVYKQFPTYIRDGVKNQRQQVTRRYNPGQSVHIGLSVKL